MSEDTRFRPYLSADLGEVGGRVEWDSAEAALAWLNQLTNQWNWLSSIGHGPTNQAWTTISSNLNTPIQNIQQAQYFKNQGQPQNEEGQLQAARSNIESYVAKNIWLLPNSAQRQFVEDLRDSGKQLEAGLIVANWQQQDLGGPPVRNVVSALLLCEFFERGIKDRAKTETAALKRLAGSLQTELSNYQSAERAQTGKFDELFADISGRTTAQEKLFNDAQAFRELSWNSLLEQKKNELTLLTETYDKHMALAAPVEYWESKRQKHSRWAFWSFVAIVACMLFAGVGLHKELTDLGLVAHANQTPAADAVQKMAGSLQQRDPSAQATVAAKIENDVKSAPVLERSSSIFESNATWRAGSLLLLATLCFWFIRLLVRIFLSNLHLENDAAERVTMAKTYLALIRDDALPKGDSVSTVLAALFRPTGDGIVKDEGLPPTAMEWMTKLGGK